MGFAQSRTSTTLIDGWEFKKGEVSKPHSLEDNQGWESVTIPHDWAIKGPFILDGNGSTGKLPWKGQAWYRKQLDIPKSSTGKRLYLIFDGVMAFPKKNINGVLAGEWDYGYNSFYVDITDFVKIGSENILTVHADTRAFDSRWYPGAGIYRKVQLLAVNPVHVDIWRTYINTPTIKPHYADVRINTTINNYTKDRDSISVVHSIVDMDGSEVAKGQVGRWIKSGKTMDLETTITLLAPIRWDTENPYLYKMKTKVYKGRELVDNYSTKFGVRTIRFDPDYGFFLNERRVQLKGVNNHHDYGPLGSAFYPRAMERQLEIMKSMGVNAFRNSHNAAAPELLSMCDSMGILFFNEVFDLDFGRKVDRKKSAKLLLSIKCENI